MCCYPAKKILLCATNADADNPSLRSQFSFVSKSLLLLFSLYRLSMVQCASAIWSDVRREIFQGHKYNIQRYLQVTGIMPCIDWDVHRIFFSMIWRRHGMSGVFDRPPSRNLQGDRCRAGFGDEEGPHHLAFITRRTKQTWQQRRSTSDGTNSTWRWWHSLTRMAPYWPCPSRRLCGWMDRRRSRQTVTPPCLENESTRHICICPVHIIQHWRGGTQNHDEVAKKRQILNLYR